MASNDGATKERVHDLWELKVRPIEALKDPFLFRLDRIGLHHPKCGGSHTDSWVD